VSQLYGPPRPVTGIALPFLPINFSSYLTGNTLLLRYKDQPVNAVQGNNLCLFREAYEIRKCSLWGKNCRIILILKRMVHILTIYFKRLTFIFASYLSRLSANSVSAVVHIFPGRYACWINPVYAIWSVGWYEEVLNIMSAACQGK
jgi:hypothetical protein